MAPTVTSLVDEIISALVAAGEPGRAEQQRRYLKSELYFLGASQSATRRLAHAVARRERLDHDRTVALAEALWGAPVFERRAAAIVVLDVGAPRLAAADLPFVETLLRESETWALVDGLAVGVAGAIVERDRTATRAVLDRWARDPDRWLRRASLLAELPALRRGAPLEAFGRRADPMLEETEPFIRKAIGWVLREAGRRRPDEVVAWLEPRARRASRMTVREAVKHLPLADAMRLIQECAPSRPGATARGAGVG